MARALLVVLVPTLLLLPAFAAAQPASAPAPGATPSAGAAAPEAPPRDRGPLRGARLVYIGVEPSLLLGKSTPHQVAAMFGIDPNVEVHLTPRLSLQAHGFIGVGLETDQPRSWWDLGVRGIWRPPFLPAQSFGAGLGLGQARERRTGRPEFEPVTPHVDAQVGIWEFDLDPVRFGPVANFCVNFQGSYFGGIGIAGQFGFGPIRTTR